MTNLLMAQGWIDLDYMTLVVSQDSFRTFQESGVPAKRENPEVRHVTCHMSNGLEISDLRISGNNLAYNLNIDFLNFIQRNGILSLLLRKEIHRGLVVSHKVGSLCSNKET